MMMRSLSNFTTRQWLVVAALLFVLAGYAGNVSAARGLAGAKPFNLVVEEVDGVAKELGFSRTRLMGLVESELKRSGIVPTVAGPRFLYLQVIVKCLPSAPVCAASVEFEFNRLARIEDSFEAGVTVWDEEWVVVARKDLLREKVSKVLREQGIPRFVRDYRKANP